MQPKTERGHPWPLKLELKVATDKVTIEQIYNQYAREEYARLEKSPLHEAEFNLTADLLSEYVKQGDRVLDIGAGPGRYAEHLIRTKQCHVGLVDLSEESLRLFKERIPDSLAQYILFCKQSCATDLSWVESESFQVVLLMGPLYHLVAAEERTAVLSECRRALRSGGIVIAAFISPYHRLALPLRNPEQLDDLKPVEQLLKDGQTHHLGMQQWRCWPSQARAMMEAAGFETLRLRNLEGIGSLLPEKQVEVLTTDQKKQAWFDLLRMTCEIPDLLGATLHFVYVGKRP